MWDPVIYDTIKITADWQIDRLIKLLADCRMTRQVVCREPLPRRNRRMTSSVAQFPPKRISGNPTRGLAVQRKSKKITARRSEAPEASENTPLADSTKQMRGNKNFPKQPCACYNRCGALSPNPPAHCWFQFSFYNRTTMERCTNCPPPAARTAMRHAPSQRDTDPRRALETGTAQNAAPSPAQFR